MERQTFLESVVAMGTLLTTTGCMDGGSESQPTADTETGNETGNSTTGETTTEAEPAGVSSPELTFHANSGVLRVVHTGGEKVADEGVDEVCVTVNDERTATQVADGDKGGEFPASIGNFPEIKLAESGLTVGVVWVGSEGVEEILATHKVGAGETATTTTTNETATNETTANETATNETATTMATETTTSSSNETSN